MNLVYSLISILQHLLTAFKIKVFQKRFRTLKLFGIKPALVRSESILVVITHVVPSIDKLSEADKKEKVERLQLTLEGILDSLSSYTVDIVINTLSNMHLCELLPTYLRDKVSIYFSSQQDPMMVEFDVFEIFKDNTGKYHNYLFIEDDIILSDPWFVSKIKLFNQVSGDKRRVLLPHRYEMIEGNKFFIDQEIFYDEQMKTFVVNPLFSLKVGEIEFQEFENPHAATYLLNQEQLDLRIKSGNKWKNQVVAFGVLESAATFSLYENFQFLKSSLASIDFLQVKHWGTKYSSRFYKN